MHELAIAQRLIEVMTGAAPAGGRIVSARLLLGELSGVQAEALGFAFEASVPGTRAEGCRLDVVRVPSELRCRACGATRGGDLLDPCPVCGHVGCEVLKGRELQLESLEVGEDTCPATGGAP